jgi:tetratricopeptide (TPR) repeat protein
MKKITCFILIIFTVLVGEAQDKRIDRFYKRIDSLKLLIQKEKNDTAKIRKLVLLGEVYVRMKNDSALVFLQDAIRLSEKIGFKQEEIHARSSMAFFLFYVKLDYATSLELLLYNLKREEQTDDTAYIFSNTMDVSLIYTQIEDYEKALEYIKKLQNLTNSGLFKDSATLSHSG